MELHGKIMNLPGAGGLSEIGTTHGEQLAYKRGHRDARHAAAELALKADAVAEAASALLTHLDRINCLTREEEPFLTALREALEA